MKISKLLSCHTCYRRYLILVVKVAGLIILLASNIHPAQAQNPTQRLTDSLMQIIYSSSGTKKVDALNQAAESIQKYSAKKAQPLAEQALKLSGKLNYLNGKGNAFQNMANIFSRKGESKTAFALLEKAIAMYSHSGEREAVFNCLLKQSSVYQNLGNKDKEVETYLHALHLALEMRRVDLQSLVASSLSQCFTNMNDKPNALLYVSKAMVLSKNAGNPNASGYANMAMANYMSNFGLHQSADGYFRTALKYFISVRQPAAIVACYVQIGNYFLHAGALDSAQACYFSALKITRQINDMMTQATAYSLIAHTYQLEHKLRNALAFHQKAFKLRQDYGNLSLTGSSLSNIGTVYFEMGTYPKALKYFQLGLKTAQQAGHTAYIKNNYQHIFKLYISVKNYKKAFEYSLLLSAIDDSILKNEARKKFADINYKHEVEQKQQAIGFLSKENELQKLRLKQTRYATYVLGAVILLFVIIALLLNIQSILRARHRQMDLEQKLLRSQMNPHFIFNALIAIQSFIYKKESAEAAKYLSSFARLIRLVLSNSHSEFVTLKCEIDTLSNYLSLQKLRFENKFDYTIVVDPFLDTERVNLPPMLAQPFVENSIEHGIFALETPGRIVVNIRKIENNLLIEVNDNGVGRAKGREMRKKSDKSHESLATRITEERISSLNRKYAWKISLQITDLFKENKEPAGTRVILCIPLLST
jgi:tetratricopeptide (TPR) repeat protein